jgi:hypothetical protein
MYVPNAMAAGVHVQEFAEKPKGEELQKMRVDTTQLGKASCPANMACEGQAAFLNASVRFSCMLS